MGTTSDNTRFCCIFHLSCLMCMWRIPGHCLNPYVKSAEITYNWCIFCYGNILLWKKEGKRRYEEVYNNMHTTAAGNQLRLPAGQ